MNKLFTSCLLILTHFIFVQFAIAVPDEPIQKNTNPDQTCRQALIGRNRLVLPDLLIKLTEILNQSLIYGRGLKTTLANIENDNRLLNPKAFKDPSLLELRKQILALTGNENTLRITTETALANLRAKSQQVRTALLNQAFKTPISVDILIVGAGIHEVIYLTNLLRGNPSLNVLTVEKSDSVASTFFLPGYFFELNSRNGASNGNTIPTLGSTLNINELSGAILQVPDVSGVRFPPAITLGSVATINRSLIKSPIIFDVELINSERVNTNEKLPGKWKNTLRIFLEDGTTKEVNVFSNHVRNISGLGNAAIPEELSEYSRTFVTQEINKKNRLGIVQTAQQVIERGLPLDLIAGKKVGIIGQGDSALVIAQYMGRLANLNAYGEDVSQAGDVQRILCWGFNIALVGGCNDFVKGSRLRYAAVGGLLKKGILFLSPNRVTNIEPTPDGKVRVFSQKPPNLNEDGNQLYRKLFEENPTINFSDTEVDLLILATGYEDLTGERLKNYILYDKNKRPISRQNPLNRAEGALVDIRGPLRNNQETILARALTPVNNQKVAIPEGVIKISADIEKFYSQGSYVFVGPSAGPMATNDELNGVDANQVSIAINGPRTQGIALSDANNIRPQYPFKLELRKTPLELTPIEIQPAFDLKVSLPVLIENNQVFGLRPYLLEPEDPKPGDEILFPLLIQNLFEEAFEIGQSKTINLSFIIFQKDNGFGITQRKDIIGDQRTYSYMSDKTFSKLARSLQNNYDLLELINSFIGFNSSQKSITIEITVTEEGKFKINNIRYENKDIGASFQEGDIDLVETPIVVPNRLSAKNLLTLERRSQQLDRDTIPNEFFKKRNRPTNIPNFKQTETEKNETGEEIDPSLLKIFNITDTVTTKPGESTTNLISVKRFRKSVLPIEEQSDKIVQNFRNKINQIFLAVLLKQKIDPSIVNNATNPRIYFVETPISFTATSKRNKLFFIKTYLEDSNLENSKKPEEVNLKRIQFICDLIKNKYGILIGNDLIEGDIPVP